MLIKKVHTNCACLVAKAPEQPIPPGGAGVITLQYSVDGRRRSFMQEALVESNDPVLPAVVLRAAGFCDQLVNVLPQSLDCGIIPRGQTKRAYLFVRYSGENILRLSNLQAQASGLSFSIKETEDPEVTARLLPGFRGQVELTGKMRILEVTLTPTGDLVGRTKGEITLKTNIERFEKFTIPVTGQIALPVVAAPADLCFGEVGSNDMVECSVDLVSLVGRSFRVVSASSDSHGIECFVDETVPANGHRKCRFRTTGAAAHKLSGSAITVRIESGGTEFDLDLPVFAWRSPAESGGARE